MSAVFRAGPVLGEVASIVLAIGVAGSAAAECPNADSKRCRCKNQQEWDTNCRCSSPDALQLSPSNPILHDYPWDRQKTSTASSKTREEWLEQIQAAANKWAQAAGVPLFTAESGAVPEDPLFHKEFGIYPWWTTTTLPPNVVPPSETNLARTTFLAEDGKIVGGAIVLNCEFFCFRAKCIQDTKECGISIYEARDLTGTIYHELGHLFGLGDIELSQTTAMTMTSATAQCDLRVANVTTTTVIFSTCPRIRLTPCRYKLRTRRQTFQRLIYVCSCAEGLESLSAMWLGK